LKKDREIIAGIDAHKRRSCTVCTFFEVDGTKETSGGTFFEFPTTVEGAYPPLFAGYPREAQL
jgi:hypothetical protein